MLLRSLQTRLLLTLSEQMSVQVIAAAGKRNATLPASFAIDMWSLGAIAYEIITG